MIRVCPKPPIWASIDKKLSEFSGTHVCSPPTPPKPLILAGWAYSTNKQKQDRWQETIDWAKPNSCIKNMMTTVVTDTFGFQIGRYH